MAQEVRSFFFSSFRDLLSTGVVSVCPYAMKFEDRSLGEIARQERCARGDAWELARKIYKLKKRKAKLHSIPLLRSGL